MLTSEIHLCYISTIRNTETTVTELVRFSVSLEKELLDRFDKQIEEDSYPTRSKAIADLIRDSIVKQEWKSEEEIAGVITMVYDHHKRELSQTLTHVQHDYHDLIISTQHIHLDHHNCLEIVVVKGKPKIISELAAKLKTTKGVKHAQLSMATTGKHI